MRARFCVCVSMCVRCAYVYGIGINMAPFLKIYSNMDEPSTHKLILLHTVKVIQKCNKRKLKPEMNAILYIK